MENAGWAVSLAVAIAACLWGEPYIYKSASGTLPLLSHNPLSKSAHTMQRPTLTNVCVRNTSDGQVIFEAVAKKILPLITKRLTPVERRELIRPGSVFVWEERGPDSRSSGARIERWTDGRQWGPSRVRDEFLVYTERVSGDDTESPQDQLIKQTYSVWVPGVPTSWETRKWHLVAYSTPRSARLLQTIDHEPDLARLNRSPRISFRPARTTRGRICDEIHRIILPSRGDADAWSSPNSSPSGDDRLPKIERLVPPAPWKIPKWDRRRGVEFTEHRQAARELAPLRYLQSISAPPRQPLDDFAIRAFDSNRM